MASQQAHLYRLLCMGLTCCALHKAVRVMTIYADYNIEVKRLTVKLVVYLG